ncbi:unnamed protein product [Penicillium olsonii]|nr:unnamed protein product [Penicillium olsonii]
MENERAIPDEKRPADEDTKRRAVVADAQEANTNEHTLTVKQALKAYPWALFWTLACSMSIIMEGYDNILITSFFGFPTFKRTFGQYYAEREDWEIPGPWQSVLSSGPVAGSILGAFLNGFIIHRHGFRFAFMLGLTMMIGFVFISFFGRTVEIQTLGQVFIPWGMFATIGPAYASEICPLAFRPYLTAYVNVCFAIGQFISAGVIQSLVDRTDEWAYRIPFALQWIWPAPLLCISWFMPESPWWLVQNGRYKEAERSVERFMASFEKPKAAKVVAMMIHTNQIEQEMQSGTSYLDCFRGTDRRRTEIACTVFAGQILCGAPLAFSATYFFQQAGLSTENSYKIGLAGTAIAFLGTTASWLLMARFDRRSIYLFGMAFMSICLLIIGLLDLPIRKQTIANAQSALCIVWLLAFSLSAGPIGWTVPAEVSSTRLRSKTICLARNTYYICQISSNIIQPYMLNPTEWNWQGRTGFFWFGFSSLTFLWAFFRMAETKGRTYEELDILFAAKVPTRQFSRCDISPQQGE